MIAKEKSLARDGREARTCPARPRLYPAGEEKEPQVPTSGRARESRGRKKKDGIEEGTKY